MSTVPDPFAPLSHMTGRPGLPISFSSLSITSQILETLLPDVSLHAEMPEEYQFHLSCVQKKHPQDHPPL